MFAYVHGKYGQNISSFTKYLRSKKEKNNPFIWRLEAITHRFKVDLIWEKRVDTCAIH